MDTAVRRESACPARQDPLAGDAAHQGGNGERGHPIENGNHSMPWIAAERLVAAVAIERDRHVMPGKSGEIPGRDRGRVPYGSP